MPYRYAKTRPTLPTGYQFGDAGAPRVTFILPTVRCRVTQDGVVPGSYEVGIGNEWRAPHVNDAEQLKRREAEA